MDFKVVELIFQSFFAIFSGEIALVLHTESAFQQYKLLMRFLKISLGYLAHFSAALLLL